MIRSLPREKELVGAGTPDKPISGVWAQHNTGSKPGSAKQPEGMSVQQLAGAGLVIACCFMLAKALRD